MALSSNYYALIVQRLEKILVQKAAPKVLEWPSYGNFGKVTQNPHFLKKEWRGDKGKFLKNRKKSTPGFKGARALWRKCHYPLICIHLYCKDWRRFWRYGNFGKVTQIPHFLKKERRGDQGKFFKNRPKTSPRLKGSKALWRKLHSTLISMHFYCKYWRRFWRRKRL